MNTKVISIACAVVAFFAGAIWLSEANAAIVGTLVAFLEVCAGFGCGFWFKKSVDDFKLNIAADQILSYEEKVNDLKEKLNKALSEKVALTSKSKTKKTKE